MKLWQKQQLLNKTIEQFTVNDDYILDQKLLKYDCQASIAHAKMLQKIKIISTEELQQIIKVLEEIIQKDKKSHFIIKQEDEDCHTAIENYLIQKLGDIGKKIHTARSRNDQVLTALRLYYKNEINNINIEIDNFIKSLYSLNKKYGQNKIPGYTHTRKAMPSSIKTWSNAFIESMKDNKKLMKNIYKYIDQSPLGTGAGYKIPIKIDRKLTAKILGFEKIQKNPLYVQNSRGKFESTILHGLTQIMIDLNKISTDLIFFSIPELGYIELPTEFCTGSSIMPHKKNPDILELVRAKYHQIVSYEFEIKNMTANLLSGYNRDIQLTKKPVINGFEITKNSLKIMSLIIENIQVNKEICKKAMTKELYATEEVYNLVKKGDAFRDAYHQISNKY